MGVLVNENLTNTNRVVNKVKYNKLNLIILAIFPILFTVLGASLYLKLILLAYFLFVLFQWGKKEAIFTYLYLVFFIPITRGDSTTIVAPIGIILSLVLSLDLLKGRKIGIGYFILLFVFGIYAARSMLQGDSYSILSIIYDLLIVIFIKFRLINNEQQKHEFWEKLYFYVFFAALVSIACGIFSFQGLSDRFSLPIGIDRACLLLVGGMIYPLFHIKNLLIKFGLIFILMFSLILTVSMTAIICLVTFIVILLFYYLFMSKKVSVFSKYLLTVLVLAGFVVLGLWWTNGSGIAAVDKMIDRMKLILTQISNNELDKATTGRYEIIKVYLSYFNNFSLPDKLFGGGMSNYYQIAYYRNYSHNTPIDLLLFVGIIPSILFGLFVFKQFFNIKNSEERVKVILFKSVMLTTCLSVSMLTGSYWLPFVLL